MWFEEFEPFEGLSTEEIVSKVKELPAKDAEELSDACTDFLIRHISQLGSEEDERVVEAITSVLWEEDNSSR